MCPDRHEDETIDDGFESKYNVRGSKKRSKVLCKCSAPHPDHAKLPSSLRASGSTGGPSRNDFGRHRPTTPSKASSKEGKRREEHSSPRSIKKSPVDASPGSSVTQRSQPDIYTHSSSVGGDNQQYSDRPTQEHYTTEYFQSFDYSEENAYVDEYGEEDNRYSAPQHSAYVYGITEAQAQDRVAYDDDTNPLEDFVENLDDLNLYRSSGATSEYDGNFDTQSEATNATSVAHEGDTARRQHERHPHVHTREQPLDILGERSKGSRSSKSRKSQESSKHKDKGKHERRR